MAGNVSLQGAGALGAVDDATGGWPLLLLLLWQSSGSSGSCGGCGGGGGGHCGAGVHATGPGLRFSSELVDGQ